MEIEIYNNNPKRFLDIVCLSWKYIIIKVFMDLVLHCISETNIVSEAIEGRIEAQKFYFLNSKFKSQN